MNIPGRKYFKDESIYSDWFSRQGDDMIVRIELVDYTPSTSLDVTFEVFSKNTEVPGNGTLVTGPSPSISSVVVEAPAGTPTQADLFYTIFIQSGTADSTGLGELVRLRATGTNGNASDWLEIRIHPPVFFNRSIG